MISPLTTMGMAGGHETVGEAQMRPTEFETCIVSCGAKMAVRIEHAEIGEENFTALGAVHGEKSVF